LAANDTELIEGYTADRMELVAKKESLEARLAELEDAQGRSEEEKRDAVTKRTKERQTYLAQIESEKARLEKALDEMEAQSKALERVIAELQAKEGLPQSGAFNDLAGHGLLDNFLLRLEAPSGLGLRPVPQRDRLRGRL
jgi:predicted nuclease with TOPRIM domain